jgi:hypothetical protein
MCLASLKSSELDSGPSYARPIIPNMERTKQSKLVLSQRSYRSCQCQFETVSPKRQYLLIFGRSYYRTGTCIDCGEPVRVGVLVRWT